MAERKQKRRKQAYICGKCSHIRLLHYPEGCGFPALYRTDKPEPPPCGCKRFTEILPPRSRK